MLVGDVTDGGVYPGDDVVDLVGSLSTTSAPCGVWPASFESGMAAIETVRASLHQALSNPQTGVRRRGDRDAGWRNVRVPQPTQRGGLIYFNFNRKPIEGWEGNATARAGRREQMPTNESGGRCQDVEPGPLRSLHTAAIHGRRKLVRSGHRVAGRVMVNGCTTGQFCPDRWSLAARPRR